MTRTRSLVVLAFIAAALAACDSDRESSRLTGPQADLLDWRWAEPITVATTTEEIPTSTVIAVVGPQGGKIANGDHVLVVPRRSVASDTEFTFTVIGGNTLEVSLTAKTVLGGLPVTQFTNTLTLKMNYRTLNVSDPSRLIIAWLIDGTTEGAKQAVPSTVDTKGKYVNGSLTHFTDYAPALQ